MRLSHPRCGTGPRPGAARLSRRALLKLAGALVLSGRTVHLGRGREPEPPPDFVVELKDFFFDPPGLVLRRGQRVSWVLIEDVLGDGHTATAYHPAFDKVLRIPEEAPPWSSGFLFEPGEHWSREFVTAGVHDYFCVPHEEMGMVGRLLVEEATGPGAQPPERGLSPAGRAAIPALEELQGPAGEVFNVEGVLNAIAWALARGDRAGAHEAWASLHRDLATALPQLWPALTADEREAVRAASAQLGELLVSGSLAQVRRAVETLKVLLEGLVFV